MTQHAATLAVLLKNTKLTALKLCTDQHTVVATQAVLVSSTAELL
jgi:hypothetical protein